MATAATSGRMLFAFGRDGLGPKSLAHIHPATGGPRRATWLVVVLGGVVNTLCGLTGWPPEDTGNRAIDTYFLFAVAGSVCLMVCYLLVEVATVWFVVGPASSPARRNGPRRRSGVSCPRCAGDRDGAVVQRQGRQRMVGCSPARIFWCAAGLAVSTRCLPNRPGGRHGTCS